MNKKQKLYQELDTYTKHEINDFKGGRVAIADTMDDIKSFIDNSKKLNINKKLFFGKIGKKLAKRIDSDIGIDIKNII